MKKVRTHYDNLKVARDAPPEVIRAAYKSLSQKYHPDRNANSSESQRVMKIINESYAVLSDSDARRKHNAWIAEQESSGPPENHSNHARKQKGFSPPEPGKVQFYALDEATKKRMKERVSGSNKNQYRIKLYSVFWNYIWCLLLSGWFFYIYASARGYRWESETTYWYAGITVIVSLLLARNISLLYTWYTKPLKSWLIVTPLYLIKFHLDQISYWPIWSISDIKATHNYRNGSYQNTSLTVAFGDKRENFIISPESAYQQLINKLQEYDAQFRSAVNSNDIDYIINNDDFLSARRDAKKTKKDNTLASGIIYTLLLIIVFAFLGMNYKTNQDRPDKLTYSKSTTPYNSQPQVKPEYIRPTTAPNGAPWPSSAGYVANYPKLNTSGLSSVTVDNSKNDSDVFVKLVSIATNESYPARVFFIPAFGKFKISSIDAGLYDIRYRDLTTGGLARSESFTLEEESTYEGTRYSNMTMTIYKVRNGNMQTYGLSESEF